MRGTVSELDAARKVYDSRIKEYWKLEKLCQQIEDELPHLTSGSLIDLPNITEDNAAVLAKQEMMHATARSRQAQLSKEISEFPLKVQTTEFREVETRSKEGNLVAAGSVLIFITRIAALAQQFIPVEHKARFASSAQKIQAEFLAQHPQALGDVQGELMPPKNIP